MREPYEDEGATGTGSGLGRGRREHADAARLRDELVALGRALDGPGTNAADPGESMAERVLSELLAMETSPAPARLSEGTPATVAGRPGPGAPLRSVRRRLRERRRVLMAGLCGAVTVLVLTPPVRAAVVDWFDFGGVEVRYDPSAAPSAGARVPGCPGPSLTSAQAARRAGFTPPVPGVLGAPDTITVTPEPQGRLLMNLCWREHGRTVRIDAFPARLDIGFTKTVREPPEWLSIDDGETPGSPALWFARPHRLSFRLLDADGDSFSHAERTAGPTLLWTHHGEVTLRLEGVSSKARALDIARSLK
ncbi:hypothetical protein ABZ341_38610 [Streptomyces sp. NPDC006173]|uniref:hypothetical protein n=1 Tax=Streptomyces sp. NPDC006173 TaxID=3155349 RepID=UPI0033FFDDB7